MGLNGKIRVHKDDNDDAYKYYFITTKDDSIVTKEEASSRVYLNDGKMQAWSFNMDYKNGRFFFIYDLYDKIHFTIPSLATEIAWADDGGCLITKDTARVSFSELYSVMFSTLPDFKELDLGESFEWVESETGKPLCECGRVSSNALLKWMGDCGVTLRDFLLNKRYYVVLEREGNSVFENLMCQGLINEDLIEKIDIY